MEKVSLPARFLAKVCRHDEAGNLLPGCWEWIASIGSHGYGHMGVGSLRDGTRHNETAPRIAWELAFGPIPAGLSVLHRCDNR